MSIPFGISLNPIGIVKGVTSTVGGFGLSFITSWVLGATKAALEQVATLIGDATSPNVSSTWFSVEYWRVCGLAALLTVPFLFAAAVQAMLRSDPSLLVKVVFGYLPLSLIGISIATPIVTLLLSATDEMCAIVSGSAITGGASFLDKTAAVAGALTAVNGSAFFAVVLGLMTLAAALMLALELLVREAAVYVVVLMLPMTFAAMVWPARRVWAVRTVELLVSLILSKFVIVSVLSLAGSAFGSGNGVTPMLTAMSLIFLSTFAPWALMRLLPFTELAAAAAGTIRQEVTRSGQQAHGAANTALGRANDPAAAIAQQMRALSSQGPSSGGGAPPPEDGGTTPTGGSGGPSGPGGGSPDGSPVDDMLAGAFGTAGVERAGGEMARGLHADTPGAETAGGASGGPTTPIDPAWDAPDFSWSTLHKDADGWSGAMTAAVAPGAGGPAAVTSPTEPGGPPAAGVGDAPPVPTSTGDAAHALQAELSSPKTAGGLESDTPDAGLADADPPHPFADEPRRPSDVPAPWSEAD